MPTAKKKEDKPKKPKLQYIDKDFQWVLKAEFRDDEGVLHPAGTPMNPKMPSWAVRSGGEIDFARFIRTWNDATTLEDVHKKFFWKKPNQLSRQRTQISDWLEGQDIHPLKTLRSKRAARKAWNKQLKALLDAGELTRKYSRRPRQKEGESAEDYAKRLHEALAKK
tara:strand:+ start:35 stop:532 length:498 start_codon:yes stop_codon:yes gene_type:complete